MPLYGLETYFQQLRILSANWISKSEKGLLKMTLLAWYMKYLIHYTWIEINPWTLLEGVKNLKKK